jgi:hypothetical protein
MQRADLRGAVALILEFAATGCDQRLGETG